MIDTIYIPTLGRSSNQITFDNLPSNVQDICILVVQPHEVELYKNYPTLVLPDDYIGITETRKWIHIQAQDTKYGVFDDDLRFIERTPQGEKTKAPMDELGWEYFNPVYATNVLQHASSGLPDITANPSLDADDFQQYVYTAGVKDDGIGTSLEPFVSFSIKIIMTGTNTSQPPRIKDLRCIALAT